MALSDRRESKDQYYIMRPSFYILRLQSGQLYIGSTANIEQRFKDHQSGRAGRTTKLDPPLELLYTEEFDSFPEARKRENQVKRWSRAKKEMLAKGDPSKLKSWKKQKGKQ
jgi:putative endonuclease